MSEATIHRVLGNKSKSVITDLVAIGVLSVTKRGGECTYSFPFLYRKGLDLTQGSEDEDDD